MAERIYSEFKDAFLRSKSFFKPFSWTRRCLIYISCCVKFWVFSQSFSSENSTWNFTKRSVTRGILFTYFLRLDFLGWDILVWAFLLYINKQINYYKNETWRFWGTKDNLNLVIKLLGIWRIKIWIKILLVRHYNFVPIFSSNNF